MASQEEDMGQFETVEQLEESTTSLVSSSTSAYSSFPVDVVVYVRVQVRTTPTLTVHFLNYIIFPPNCNKYNAPRLMDTVGQKSV